MNEPQIAPSRPFKNDVYDLFASVGKALANGHRLEMLELLSQAEWHVEALAQAAGLSVANASRHLQLLRGARLVTARREGVRIYYRIADENAYDLWRALRQFCETKLPDIQSLIDAYLTDRSRLEAISAQELRSRLRDGDLVLLDVRPANEFASGHIPGAISMPIGELESRLAELPLQHEIIAYCRGRYCVYSDRAVDLLSSRGYRARRLEISPRDWNSMP